jgi:hypothetical protein
MNQCPLSSATRTLTASVASVYAHHVTKVEEDGCAHSAARKRRKDAFREGLIAGPCDRVSSETRGGPGGSWTGTRYGMRG